ncbi:hypothetical protein BMI84_07200 [Vibrio parahaemolyticus]|nr:hypothetical protein BMI84_07200 [Vibrio parahaemolyticus]
MNCSNKFKLTAVALMVGTAMNANAALYQVIEVRSVESDSAERQGAGLGWLALTMLGLFGFRRK